MLVSEILPLSSIRVPFHPADKPAAIQGLLDALPLPGPRQNPDPYLTAILEREAALSTGIGGGFAVPHAKCDIPQSIMTAFGVSPKGVEFAALDGKPVHFFFLILCRKDSAALHLKMLSALATLFRNESFKKSLLECLSPAEAMKAIQREEKR